MNQNEQLLLAEAVEYQVGNLPVVITVPHGGILDTFSGLTLAKRHKELPAGVNPETLSNRYWTCSDSRTIGIARQISRQIEQLTGGKPFMVIAKFKRKCVDANRPKAEAVPFEWSPERVRNEFIYDLYHQRIREAILAVRNANFTRSGLIVPEQGHAMLFDIHGQGSLHGKKSVYIGMGGMDNERNTTVTLNSHEFQCLMNDFFMPFHQHLMSWLPYTRIPDPEERALGVYYAFHDHPIRKKYKGGYTVLNYGGWENTSAIQFEFGSYLRTMDIDKNDVEAIQRRHALVGESFARAFHCLWLHHHDLFVK